ncbi:MAG: hypothetical protein RLZZ342_52 [Candidatus Parcubacteria bacterium]
MGMNRISFTFLAAVMFVYPGAAHAASLSIETDTGAYGIGDTFIATVRIDNGDACINAAEVQVEYPIGTLRAVDFSRGDSIFSLWIQDPQLDTERGVVSFAGGTPGGYCGRVQGDPSQSNILGKIVFSVVGPDTGTTALTFSPASRVYLHDGLGSVASVEFKGASLSVEDKPTLTKNPWLEAVKSDATPPESFVLQVRSDREVFNGKYYIVFSTTDKQSGLDHYEIAEGGAWKRITSPYVVKPRALDDGVQVRAVDKAGNVRVGDFDPQAIPPRQYTYTEMISYGLFFAMAFVAVLIRLYMARRDRRARE